MMPVSYSSGTGGYIWINYGSGTAYVPYLTGGNDLITENHLPKATILSTGASSNKGMVGLSKSTTDHNVGVIYYQQAGGGGADDTAYIPVLTASDGTIDSSQLPQASYTSFGAIKCDYRSGSPIDRYLAITNSSSTYYVPVLDSNNEIYSGNLPWSLIKSYIYPVGSVYETTSSTANPTTLFGGTWQLLGQLVTDADVELTTSEGNLFADGYGAIKQTYKWERTA